MDNFNEYDTIDEVRKHYEKDPEGVGILLKGDKSDLGIGRATTVTWDNIQGKPTEFPPEPHMQGWDTITSKPAEFTPAAHRHAQADIDGLPQLNAQVDQNVLDIAELKQGGGGGGGPVTWANIIDKPTEFAPSPHRHKTSDVNGLDTSLSQIATNTQAIAVNTGDIADLNNKIGGPQPGTLMYTATLRKSNPQAFSTGNYQTVILDFKEELPFYSGFNLTPVPSLTDFAELTCPAGEYGLFVSASISVNPSSGNNTHALTVGLTYNSWNNYQPCTAAFETTTSTASSFPRVLNLSDIYVGRIGSGGKIRLLYSCHGNDNIYSIWAGAQRENWLTIKLYKI